jgi:DNA replication protein DnaC
MTRIDNAAPLTIPAAQQTKELCKVHNTPLTMYFIPTTGRTLIQCEICEAKKTDDERQRVAAQLEQCRQLMRAKMPMKYGYSLQQIVDRGGPVQQLEAANSLLSLAHEIAHAPDSTMGRSVLLVGAPGTGKTELSCGLIRSLINMGCPAALYSDFYARSKALMQAWTSKEPGYEENMVKDMVSPRLLVVDDVKGLDKDGGLSGGLSALWDNIVDQRYTTPARWTLYVGNISSPDELHKLVGPRIASRMSDNGLRYVLTYPSFRRWEGDK